MKRILVVLACLVTFVSLSFFFSTTTHSQSPCAKQSVFFGGPGALTCTSQPETLTQTTAPVPISVTISGGQQVGNSYFSTGLTPATGCERNFPQQIEISFSQPVSLAKVQIQNGLNEPADFTATSNNGTAITLNVQGAGNEYAYFAETGITHIVVEVKTFIYTYPPAYWELGVGTIEFVPQQNICSCFNLIPRPAPTSLPNAQTPNTFGWSMDVEVSDNEGLVLQNVKLGERYMAKKLSVPYYVLDKMDFSNQRLELKPDSNDAAGRSQLVNYYVTSDDEKMVIEATYQIDRIPTTSQSCLHITQRYEFYKEGRGCEPSASLPCSRFKPIVKYAYFRNGGNSLNSINVVQRHHYQDAAIPANGVGVFRDCDKIPGLFFPGPCVVKSIVFERKDNPLLKEFQSHVVLGGEDTHSWDNFHQTFKSRVLEPFDHVTNLAGCPECVHIHWRWSARAGPNYGGGKPLLPDPTDQDVDIAVVHYHAGEDHPVDYTSLVNDEVISDWTIMPLPDMPAIDVFNTPEPKFLGISYFQNLPLYNAYLV